MREDRKGRAVPFPDSELEASEQSKNFLDERTHRDGYDVSTEHRDRHTVNETERFSSQKKNSISSVLLKPNSETPKGFFFFFKLKVFKNLKFSATKNPTQVLLFSEFFDEKSLTPFLMKKRGIYRGEELAPS